jgi:2'-5' RNA ligase
VAALTPDESSALIVRVQLPPALERLRQAHLPEALRGLPAHCTLLFPFAAPGSLTLGDVAALRARIRRHPRHDIQLTGPATWPDALYAAVGSSARLEALQADLAAMFPSLPLHGGAFPFVPHVTVATGPDAGARSILEHDAWRALPITVPVSAVELIAVDDGRWRRRRLFRLGSRSRNGLSRGQRRRGGRGAP